MQQHNAWYGAEVIAHTTSAEGNEIITWEITMPKWLVAEFNTHKVEIERNSASSRAIPTTTILQATRENPVMFLDWRANAKGMAPDEQLDAADTDYLHTKWLEARNLMVTKVEEMLNLPSGRKPDKQRINRLLEPWMWTKIVCTMTSGGKIGINNFFGLRDNNAAQPEFREIASIMHKQWHTSIPVRRDWHLPYVDELPVRFGNICDDCNVEHVTMFGKTFFTYEEAMLDAALVSSARCGRVTYYKQGIEYAFEDEINRAKSFKANGHFSPLRHAAKAGEDRWYGNMYGWIQISKLLDTKGIDYVTQCCNWHDLLKSERPRD
jgi:hypothetical protein